MGMGEEEERKEGGEEPSHHKQETSLQGQDGKIPSAHFLCFPARRDVRGGRVYGPVCWGLLERKHLYDEILFRQM